MRTYETRPYYYVQINKIFTDLAHMCDLNG